MDPLSEVLSLLKLKTYMAGGFDRAGEWSVQFPRYEGIKCYALVSGRCWLLVEGISDAVRLESGECVLLPRGLSFRLASDLALHPVCVESLTATPINGGVSTWNGGGDFFGVGAHFAFAGSYSEVLLRELPPVVHIRSEADKAELRWCVERMRQELRDQRPGGSLVAQQLATTMLIQMLRLHIEGRSSSAGWLFALTNKQMRAAITAMHEEPGHRWTLQELAQRSGMSRSTFAFKFKAAVGTTPMEYLTRWRMLLAGERLKGSDQSISTIAVSLGYESESAFRNAFRKIVGYPPRQHRRV